MVTLPYLGIALAAFLGAPLFIVMTLIGLVAFSMAEIDPQAVVIEIYRVAAAPTLVSIPLFTLAGYLMAESKSPQRLLKFAQALFGNMPGGVAIVGIVTCAFFTAFTGASGVTIVALGGLLYPMLREENYSEPFSLGLITSCGSLGLLFPPSLPIILYGLVAKIDIDQLFLAGIAPGILLMVILSIWSVRAGIMAKKNLEQKKAPFRPPLWGSLKEAKWEALLPVLVLTGIYGGFTTMTEAAGLTAFYVFILEFFIHRDLSFKKDFVRISSESMTLVGAILLILCCAMGVTNYLVDEEVPMKLLGLMRTYISSPLAFLLFLNIFLLIVGCMMDIFSAIIVVVPLILPLAKEFHVAPIHLAIIFLTNLEIGYITPPVGINLFISSFRFKKSVASLYKASSPFLILLLIALMIITYVPRLSLLWVQ